MIEGTLEQVLAGEATWTVVCGDTLHVLRSLPAGSIDAFVTDPPYSSGGAFRGDRAKDTTDKYVSSDSGNRVIPPFEGDVRDQRAFELWVALWSSEAWRASADGAHMVAFSDWRQLPALCDALQAGGWLWRGIVAWDKTEATRPRNGGFRSQCEYICWTTRGPFKESGVYLDGCFRIPADRNKLHQAVKPIALMERIVTLAPPPRTDRRSVRRLRNNRCCSGSSGSTRDRHRDRSGLGRASARAHSCGRRGQHARGANRRPGRALHRGHPMTLIAACHALLAGARRDLAKARKALRTRP